MPRVYCLDYIHCLWNFQTPKYKIVINGFRPQTAKSCGSESCSHFKCNFLQYLSSSLWLLLFFSCKRQFCLRTNIPQTKQNKPKTFSLPPALAPSDKIISTTWNINHTFHIKLHARFMCFCPHPRFLAVILSLFHNAKSRCNIWGCGVVFSFSMGQVTRASFLWESSTDHFWWDSIHLQLQLTLVLKTHYKTQ